MEQREALFTEVCPFCNFFYGQGSTRLEVCNEQFSFVAFYWLRSIQLTIPFPSLWFGRRNRPSECHFPLGERSV